jgi:polysaccharide biosynthesis transport protein
MLQRTGQTGSLPYESGDAPRRVDLVDIFTFLKANRSVIAGWTVVLLTVALVYAFSATPLYTATTDITIDSRKVQLFKTNDQVVADQSLGDGEVASEVEVLNSETIAADVVKDLKLTEDPEFVNTSGGLVMRILSAVFGINEDSRELSDAQRERIATDNLRGNLTVRRVALSYVLEIEYRSPNPQKAARIANAVANAYITDQLDTRYEAARRASIWLQERIAELRNQSNTAARAVETYKEKNNIVDTGGKVLLSDLQVQQFNSQLTAATAATAEAKARLDRVDAVLQTPAPGDTVIGTVSDTLQDPVITPLRQRYLTDRETVAKFTAMLGPHHLAVINLKSEMAELQNSIANELQRIAQVYKSDYEIAKTREDSLRASLAKQVQQAGATGQAQVDLKELESASQTYHTIFENFLEKYTEAVQQQSFPISDARVITPAVPPYHKSYPKTTLVALLGLLLGLGAGVGHALLLRNLDRTVRRPREVEERFKMECLGLVPLVSNGAQPKPKGEVAKLLAAVEQAAQTAGLPVKSARREDANSKGDKLLEWVTRAGQLTGAPPRPKAPTPEPSGVSVPLPSQLTRQVLEEPFSHFSEGCRSVKTALDIVGLTRRLQCIGVISAVPGEGKSTIAVNLANLLAGGGRSTLLIDGDLRNPELTRQMGADATAGLLHVLANMATLPEATLAVPKTTLRFVPTILKQRIANTSDLLACDRMRAILEEARQKYDQVIIDLPPLGPISDSRAISPLIDAFILVVKWGDTRFEVVEEAIGSFGAAADKIVGIVLNKVDFHELRNMDGTSHGYYYNKNYAKYGYTYS